MKPAVKAALLSGLVFPGLGQIYFKQYLRGLVTMVPVLLGIVMIVGTATVGIFEDLNRIVIEGGTIDINTIMSLATRYSSHDAIYLRLVFLFILCCWLFSVIDAYRIGQREGKQSPPKK